MAHLLGTPSSNGPVRLALGLALAALTACGGGGGGSGGLVAGVNFVIEDESEDVAEATPLALDVYAMGRIRNPGDVDFWRVSLHAGMDVRVEVLATRLDPEAWNDAGLPPRVGLYEAGGMLIRRHQPLVWERGIRDLDLPHWVVPADGDYLIGIDTKGRGGGRYVVRVHEEPFPSLVAESEPVGTMGANDTVGTAEPITPNTLVHGWSQGDPDHFTFTLTDEALVTIDVFRLRLGSEDDTLDTVSVSLTSPAGNYFFSGQHAGDPAVALRRLPGTYDLALNLAGQGDYLLALTAEPIPGIAESEPNDAFVTAEPLLEDVLVTGEASSGDDWFSFSGQAGDRVEFELHDRSVFSGGTQLDFTLVEPDGTTTHALGQMSAMNRYGAILAESGVYALHLSGDSDYHLRRLPAIPAAYESEPNDTVAEAGSGLIVGTGDRMAGRIETAGDVDVFALDVEASRLHRLRVYGREGARGGFVEERFGSQLNGRVQVLDSRGRVLAEATSDASSMSLLAHAQGLIEDRVWFDLVFVAPDHGPCFVRIDDRTGAGGVRNDYWFELE